jgi:hypothetical protein
VVQEISLIPASGKQPAKTANYSNYSNKTSFDGWGLKKVKKGAHDEDSYVKADGKKAKPFNFSGSLKTLPEFHRGLKKIDETAKTRVLPTVQEVLNLSKDEFGCVDLSPYAETAYTSSVFQFGPFCVYVDDPTYKLQTGDLTQYRAVVITKLKSDTARKTARATDNPFFTFYVPVRLLKVMILSVEVLMFVNKLDPLPMKELRFEQVREETEEVEREAAERKREQVEIIRAHNKDLKEKLLGKKKAETQIINLGEEEGDSEWETTSSDADDTSITNEETSSDSGDSEEEKRSSGKRGKRVEAAPLLTRAAKRKKLSSGSDESDDGMGTFDAALSLTHKKDKEKKRKKRRSDSV